MCEGLWIEGLVWEHVTKSDFLKWSRRVLCCWPVMQVWMLSWHTVTEASGHFVFPPSPPTSPPCPPDGQTVNTGGIYYPKYTSFNVDLVLPFLFVHLSCFSFFTLLFISVVTQYYINSPAAGIHCLLCPVVKSTLRYPIVFHCLNKNKDQSLSFELVGFDKTLLCIVSGSWLATLPWHRLINA